jgi:hypothetical protein
MKISLKIFVLSVLVSLFFTFPAQAKLKGYTYPYDISQIEWETLNWTAAYRNTTTQTDPFTLDRIQYDRKIRKVLVYVSGQLVQATDENLKKCVDGIVKLFQQRLPNFEASTDLFVYYTLKQDGNTQVKYKEYKEGSFSDRSSPPEEPTPTPGYPQLAPPATSY